MAVAESIGERWRGHLADCLADPDGFVQLCVDLGVVFVGPPVREFLNWPAYVMDVWGPVVREGSKPVTMYLLCRRQIFDNIGARLMAPAQGFRLGMETIIHPPADTRHPFFPFLRSGTCTRILIYQREHNFRPINIHIADMEEVDSTLPSVVFTECCGMKICTISFPSESQLPQPSSEMLRRHAIHPLHQRDHLTLQPSSIDIQFRSIAPTVTLEQLLDGRGNSHRQSTQICSWQRHDGIASWSLAGMETDAAPRTQSAAFRSECEVRRETAGN
ncbi:hypothetical protein SISSUDRAFT_1036222 [Sistotremastrum suecicum HHB10207 ss-3]|uniref:Uncharacterized protein n=1 Tax=Sistotremastrum suecicum HHB10207 ss-3 TaxID=1314776 RepID=A0A165ZPY9_9AGAM|nr:hypothetical protein SISSUDRAFT_1036222 [Sistotremastrum suecicum HHB10207 ss-3]